MITDMLCVLAGIIGVFIVQSVLLWIIGIVVGTVLVDARLMLLYNAIVKSTEMDKEKAGIYIKGQYTLRMMITVVLTVGAFILSSYVNPWGVLICQVLLQPAVYIHNLIFGKQESIGN